MFVEHVPNAVQVEGTANRVDISNFRRVQVCCTDDGTVTWGSLPLKTEEEVPTGIPLQDGNGHTSNMMGVERRIMELSNLQWDVVRMFRYDARLSDRYLNYSREDWDNVMWLSPKQRNTFIGISLKLENLDDVENEAGASVPSYAGTLDLLATYLPAKALADGKIAESFVGDFLARGGEQLPLEVVHNHRAFNIITRTWQPAPLDADTVVAAARTALSARQETFKMVFKDYGKITICGCK
jgi:hypothetical protein